MSQAWELTDDGSMRAIGDFLDSLDHQPRLLGFGECMHEEEALPRLRNDIFRYLVERRGYRSIALEIDCLAAILANDFVLRGIGTLEEAMRDGFSHGFGESPANRELVQWMREYNQDRDDADRVRLYGFDAPVELSGGASPREVLTLLFRLLEAHIEPGLLPCTLTDIHELVGDDHRWTNHEAALDPSLSVGTSADAMKLRVITDDLTALLYSESPHLASRLSEEEWWRARLYARTAIGLMRYHAAVADDSENRVARLLGLRDELMASTLFSLVEREMQRGPTLVFAHNRHLQKYKSHWVFDGQDIEWWSAGAVVDVQLGVDYAFLATALGAAEHQGIGTPPRHTLEGVLAEKMTAQRTILNSEDLRKTFFRKGIRPDLRTETSSNLSYFALDPDYLDRTEGILFIKYLMP